MDEATKVELIGRVVYEAQRAWRAVHTTGKLLPEWEKASPEQKSGAFRVAKHTLGTVVRADASLDQMLETDIAAKLRRELFGDDVTLIDTPSTPISAPQALQSAAAFAAKAAPTFEEALAAVEVKGEVLGERSFQEAIGDIAEWAKNNDPGPIVQPKRGRRP